MDTMWFLLAVIFFVLWLAKKPQPSATDMDAYNRGFHDGLMAKSVKKQQPEPIEEDEGQEESLDFGQAESMPETVYVQPSVQPLVINQKSDKELAADKAKRDLQNINTALYVASFLLVAAAVLFVGTALPDAVKFVGVWLVTIAFYLAGLMIYKKVDRLRPAAVAFIGTGLAILPFTGIAMYNFVLPDVPMCWFITSVIGMSAYIYAAIRLNNQVIAYLAIAFAGSLSISSVSILRTSLMPYFVAMILYGSVMTVLARLRPKWVPKCFLQPIQVSNQWIIPLTITASLFSFNSLTVSDYWVLSLISAIYYGASAAVAPTINEKDVSLFVSRFLTSLSVLFMTYDFSASSWTSVGIALSVISVVQILISTPFLPRGRAGNQNHETWLWIGLVAQLLAPLVVLGNDSWPNIVVLQLIVLILSAFGVAYYLKRVAVTSFGTIALAILPIVWGYNLIQPPLENQWVSMAFLFFATLALTYRLYRNITKDQDYIANPLLLNAAIFTAEALLFTVNISDTWGIVIWLLAAALVIGTMIVEKQFWLSLVANAILFIAAVRFIMPNVEHQWLSFVFLSLSIAPLVLLALRKGAKLSLTNRQICLANFAALLLESLFFTLNVAAGWGFTTWLIAIILVYVLIFVEDIPWLSLVANAMTLLTIFRYVIPDTERQWVSLVFIGMSAVVLTALANKKSINMTFRAYQYWVANLTIFLSESACFALGLSLVWSSVIWLLIAIAIYTFVYLEKKPTISLVANSALTISAYKLFNQVQFDEQWAGVYLGVTIFTLFYAAYWVLKALEKPTYANSFWWSAIVTGGLASAFYLLAPVNLAVATTGCLGAVVVSSAIALEGWQSKRYEYVVVAAIFATVGMQRLLYLNIHDADILIYTHWWSVVFGLLALMYRQVGRSKDATTLAYVALTIMTMFSGFAALGMFVGGNVPYQMIFIIEHILLLILGVITSKKVFVIWGAVSAILAVLWMIKDTTWVLLAIAALALIGFAIYALIKQSKKLE